MIKNTKHIHNGRRATLLCLLCLMIGLCACTRGVRQPLSTPRMPTPVSPSPAALPQRGKTLPEIHYTIQAGAFSTSERAAAYADQLQSSDLDAYYFIDGDGFFKVRIDRFKTLEEALQRATQLRDQLIIEDFFIVHPHPDSVLMDRRLAMQESIVRTAQRFVGTAYRWGGASQRDGFDCSGLTMTVYRLNGLELPRSARDQFNTGTPVGRDALQPGDLVFFATGSSTSRISHVGIYSGQGQFIHAPSRGNTIGSTALSNGYFSSRYKGARRYF
jgi:hypothetical protein